MSGARRTPGWRLREIFGGYAAPRRISECFAERVDVRDLARRGLVWLGKTAPPRTGWTVELTEEGAKVARRYGLAWCRARRRSRRGGEKC